MQVPDDVHNDMTQSVLTMGLDFVFFFLVLVFVERTWPQFDPNKGSDHFVEPLKH